jgi:protein required for attachment to host cells
MVKKIISWVVLADHQHLRVFQNDGPGRGLMPLQPYERTVHQAPSRDIVTDGPGKGVSGAGGRRHAMQPKTDPHRDSGASFIADAVDMLSTASKQGEFDRLVVVAPPRALGEIRAVLSADLKRKLVGELAQDLTKSEVAVISEHVSGLLAV